MNKVFVVWSASLCLPLLAMFAGVATAQTNNGFIVERQEIRDFQELERYIEKTEGREESELDANRFLSLSEIHLTGITYMSDGLKVNGFLLQPKREGKFPAIIYNRGGGREFGSLTNRNASVQLGDLVPLVNAGYVVVASQYRGNGGSEGAEEYMGADINDVKNAALALQQVNAADTSRIGMYGWSRGGATSFVYLRKFGGIDAVAVGGPGVDFNQIAKDHPGIERSWTSYIPGYEEPRKQQLLKERSVIEWVDELPDAVPILIMHANDDKSARTRDALRLALELDRLERDYRLIVFDRGGHSLAVHRQEVYEQLIRWFDKHLKQT